jgi:hypothetical protein
VGIEVCNRTKPYSEHSKASRSKSGPAGELREEAAADSRKHKRAGVRGLIIPDLSMDSGTRLLRFREDLFLGLS